MSSDPYYFPTISKSQDKKSNMTQTSGMEELQKGLIKEGVAKRIKLESLYRKSGEPDEKEVAYSKGLVEGKRLGIAEEQQRVDTTIQLLNQAIDQINHQKSDLQEKMEEMVSALAVRIARKIIGKEIQFDNKIVLNTVKRSIAKFNTEDQITIVVHPEEKRTLEKSMLNLKNEGQITIITDSSIIKGGCIVTTDVKTFDARIESQLEIVENAFEAMRLNPDTC